MEQHRCAAAPESGQTTAEYAVVVSMITIAIVAAFVLVGNTAASILVRAGSSF
jgi:Flp pilus assembly pilin Flp